MLKQAIRSDDSLRNLLILLKDYIIKQADYEFASREVDDEGYTSSARKEKIEADKAWDRVEKAVSKMKDDDVLKRDKEYFDAIDRAISKKQVERVLKPCIKCKRPVMISVDNPKNPTVFGVDCPGCIEIWFSGVKDIKNAILYWNDLPRE